jgi:hypothetical protein
MPTTEKLGAWIRSAVKTQVSSVFRIRIYSSVFERLRVGRRR